MNSKSANRYAQALLELATEQKKEAAVEKDMLSIHQIIDDTNDFRVFLRSPLIKEDKKKKIVDAIFGKSVSELTIKFLHLIIENNREAELKSIVSAYVDQYKKQQNILVAELTSATALDDATKKTLLDKIKNIHNGEIELVESVDKDLMGGFVLKIDDRQLDATIARQLRDLRKDLILN